ncbi:carboxyl transferase domain-containing protein [Algiphilus aromaticivorans]|uniref:carboxyl transferase domain-containing protein n=1 Tax=Algiphilus aromaticivorans TaxID=382454 RepID=UPI0005C1D3EB|nr:carboxyl transferase domain-containing protein [Algiphilus aromaticivorans]
MSVSDNALSVAAPTAAVLLQRRVAAGATVAAGETLAVLESMKMQIPVAAPAAGRVLEWLAEEGDTLAQDQVLLRLGPVAEEAAASEGAGADAEGAAADPALAQLQSRLEATGDAARAEQSEKRHASGYRTARENLADLVDPDSFVEYGQLAVAAQRGRRDADSLRRDTAADGVITGRARILGMPAAVVVNDYSVLAGTQGYFHHHKLDRLFALARAEALPVVMYAEGGGGRPGDTDVVTQVAGLDLSTFGAWAGLRGVVPRIAVANGYCFAGNAALFGAADITIATRRSWIGMAGPAMIEGGGLGRVAPTEIGPVETQATNGVLDIVAEDEAEATQRARQALGLLCGQPGRGEAHEQTGIGGLLPSDRRYAYEVRRILERLFDRADLLELRAGYGRAVVTALARLGGRPVGVLASDCRHLGGAIDAEAADKAADFIALCGRSGLPVVSLVDTPGFMVGPDSEDEGAVRRMARLFAEGAQAPVPWVAIFLRRGYGLGAMALAGGSFSRPAYVAAWPAGEFGGMGLEGAVKLGYRKELEAIADVQQRQQRFDELLAQAYERGRATEMAAHLELDAVIAPEATRDTVLAVLSGLAPAGR